MNKLFNTILCLAVCAIGFQSCSKDDATNPVEGQNYSYALLTYESNASQTGYLTAFSDFPTGDVSNIQSNTLQVANSFGIVQYGNWLFMRSNSAGQAGVQKYTVGADGKMQDAGFLVDGQMFVIADANKGFYADPTRGNMLLQTFNPSTMERTGQIDLSALALPQAPFNSVGQHILAVRDGYLFAGVVHGSDLGASSGYGDDTVVNYAELAVIDISTNQLVKTIKYPGIKSLGWGSSGNQMWTLGDDGALYFYATGMGMIPPYVVSNSAIVRIPKGSTDFDNWILKADDYMTGSTFGTALVKNGKIYVQISSEPIANGFTNLNTPIWDYYSIDINSLAATKITGFNEKTQYAFGNDQCIVKMKDKIYLWMGNSITGETGYYLLDETSATPEATPAFRVTEGGTIAGFVKLNN